MKILDMNESHTGDYFHCLEEWSSDMREAGGRKSSWYARMKEKGLRVKLAADDDGTVCGMIHYAPIENTHVRGEGLFFIYCIWVHGHKEGRGNRQGHGYGSALLDAAEGDARSMGARGIAAWGLALPFWMKASWFKRHGYKKADRDGIAALMWKSFSEDARPPAWIKMKKKPELVPGKVAVTAFVNGWCPAQNATYERAKRAAQEFGDRVVFREFDTLDRTIIEEWGLVDAVFIDDKNIGSGPPPTYERIRKKIERRVKKLGG
jgi:GNAT superfamily N-acetyltransferase